MKFLLPLLLLSLPPCLAQTPAPTQQLAAPTTVKPAPPLSLREAVQTALQKNYDLQISRLDEDVARRNVSRAAAGQLPRLDGNLTRTFNYNSQNQTYSTGDPRVLNGISTNLLNANVAVNWTIFDGLAMFRAYERLGVLSQQQAQLTQAQAQQTVSDVLDAYYNVVYQAGAIVSLEEALRIGQARLDLVKAQVEVGVTAKVDLLTAQVDYNADRSALIQQQEALTTAKIQLNTLLGRTPNTDFQPADSIVVTPDLAFDTLQSQARRLNPALAAQRLAPQVAALDRRLVQAQRLPQVDLAAGYGTIRNFNGAAFLPGTRDLGTSRINTTGLNYGIVARVPIFDPDRRRLLQNARVAEERSQLGLSQTQLQVDADLLAAFQQYQNRFQLLQLEEANARLALQNVQIALARYRLGLLTPLALREAQRTRLDAAVRLLTIRFQAKQAETQLRRLSGGLAQLQ